MTVKDGTGNGIGAGSKTIEWDLIPWDSIEKSIRKLRQRIFRATREQKWSLARSLMKLMLRSYCNLLISVRRVTQKNIGKSTPGVDGHLALTSKSRMALVQQMVKHTVWMVKPTRRVYIPKPGKPGQTRPLGIPTIKNRVAQAVVMNAMEPYWEARFEPNSFGFRPGRSCHDAIEQCWLYLRGNMPHQWILDADIKSAFDKISHEFILEAIRPLPGRELAKQWLKAGFVEAETFHATESGTPQGGIISPMLLNVALHGLQKKLGPRYGFVRYADDLVACARTREEIEAAQSIIEEWLQPRGLSLHPEKTRIVHINDGFDFLGFNVRRYKGKCLCKPQKEKVLTFLAGIRQWLNDHKAAAPENVIRHLNPIIRGWSDYYRHAVSSQTFAYASHQIWMALWRWCVRRHPKKTKDWVRKKYFGLHQKGQWRFQASTRHESGERKLYLFDIHSVRIERHAKVTGDASPDDPAIREYWEKRKSRPPKRRAVTGSPQPRGKARAV